MMADAVPVERDDRVDVQRVHFFDDLMRDRLRIPNNVRVVHEVRGVY